LLAGACTTCSAADANQPAQIRLPNGSDAPDFTLETVDGNKVSLADLKGNVILLEFWAAWCPPCKAAMPHVQKLHDELAPKGLRIVCVCTESKMVDLKALLEQHPQYTMPILFDPAPKAEAVGYARYLIDGYPSFFVIDKSGKIVHSFKGFDEKNNPKTLRAIFAKLSIQ
jgi:peroxiredoxin